jgi:imidazolonepropionase-like amidohydrolase
VRDLGDRGALTIQLREAIAADEIPGPRILAATAPLTLPNGHCWFLAARSTAPRKSAPKSSATPPPAPT